MPFDYSRYTSFLRPLQSLADDLGHKIEDFLLRMPFRILGGAQNPEQVEKFLNYMQFLRQSGFVSNADQSIIHTFCYLALERQPQLSIAHVDVGLRIQLALGGDISAFYILGLRPLSSSFLFTYVIRKSNPDADPNIIQIATLLLHHGADPCDLSLHGMSIFDVAHRFGLLVECLEALMRSGFDCLDVIKETGRRQQIFFVGHGESTTVDNESIAPPSKKGLSRRRAITRDTDED
ncbi:MAG: hypothetical protein Q9182_007469 [Xanthomendoza sp. 2 TL-2023]